MNNLLLGVGGQLTVKPYVLPFWGKALSKRALLRKVLPRSGPGIRASGRGESPCRVAETTQPADNAMMCLALRSLLDLVKRASAPGASPNSGIGCPDRSRVGRIVECCLKQKEAYGLHPASKNSN